MNINNPITFKILDIVRAQRSKTYFPKKNIGTYLLSYRLQGETKFLHKEGNFSLVPGDVFFVPIGSRYSQYDKNDVEFICIHLEIRDNAPKKIYRVHPEDTQAISSLFVSLHKLWQKKSENYIYNCMSIIYKILALIHFEESTSGHTFSGRHNILQPSIEYINANLCSLSLSLKEACDASNISRVYFNKLFFNQFGTTPVKYINHKRIEKAKLLLKSGSYTREEVASLCGFRDVKYFYTVFKTVTGQATGEYIKNYK